MFAHLLEQCKYTGRADQISAGVRSNQTSPLDKYRYTVEMWDKITGTDQTYLIRHHKQIIHFIIYKKNYQFK